MRIHQLGGCGFDSNIYIIIDRRTAMIDAGTGNFNDVILSELRRIGIQSIDILINTHCHYDHAGGDSKLKKVFGCNIAIHRSEAKYLSEGDSHLTLSADFFGEDMEAVDVSEELEDGDEIKLGRHRLEVLHTPGHTEGSICLYCPEEVVLFSGDTVFADGIGRTDLPSSDTKKMGKSLARISELDISEVYPGHGPPIETGGRETVKRILNEFYPNTR